MKIIEYSFMGIKNIETLQSIRFTNKRENLSYISEEDLFEIGENNVKGMFGLNGSGKSASLYPLYVFKDIVLNKFILENPDTQNNKFIKNIISKKNQEIFMNIEFIIENTLYFIEVTIGYESDILFFKNQKLIKKINKPHARKVTIFDISDRKASLFTLRTAEDIEEQDIVNVMTFFNNIVIISSETDELKFTKTLSIELPEKLIEDIRQSNNEGKGIFTISHVLCVSNIEIYEKRIKFFEAVLKKTLKKDLLGITVDYEEIMNNGEKAYEIRDIILDYGYKLSIRNESSGIKRLFNVLDEIFEGLKNGKIVIVDELDLFLHYDLIEAIINYAMFYSEGQFIFSTHDLLAMEPLESSNRSIYVIDNNHNLITIPKGGGTNGLSKYRNGKIENTKIPINIYELDVELI